MYFTLMVFTFSSSFVFLYMWGESRNDYNSFDWYSFINLGYWFHWSSFLLFLAVFVFSYIFFLILIAVLLLFESQTLELHRCHKGIILFTLFLSITSLAIITMFWTRQWHTFYLSFQVTAPFLHVVAIFSMVLLAWPVALHFFRNKPFYHMPPVSAEEEELAKNQTIFKLSEFLTLADKANKLVIFDLYRPPRFHPYRNNWISRTLDVLLKESKIKPHLVLWLENRSRSYVQHLRTGFQHISSSAQTIEHLQKWNIGKLNLDYRRLATVDIRKYAKANITTNLWVVSEPWLYSLAWCYGVESVTTDAVHVLGNVSQPFFFLVS
ncbi:glycerophosphodiester phosphodiesterase domain-containing protein 4-like [Vipera latastei]